LLLLRLPLWDGVAREHTASHSYPLTVPLDTLAHRLARALLTFLLLCSVPGTGFAFLTAMVLFMTTSIGSSGGCTNSLACILHSACMRLPAGTLVRVVLTLRSVLCAVVLRRQGRRQRPASPAARYSSFFHLSLS
jgi:hypothetical protein